MTGRIRGYVHAVRTLRPANPEPRHRDEPSPPLRVTARIPTSAGAQQGTELTRGLERLVDGRLAELSIHRPVTVRVEPLWRSAARVEVEIDRRPLVLGDVPVTSPTWLADVVRIVDVALLRRLSILLDRPQAVRYARDLSPSWSPGTVPGDIAGYLLDNAIGLRRPDRIPVGLDQCESAAEVAETLIDDLASNLITVDVSRAALRDTPPGTAGALVDARADLFAQLGLEFPDVHIVPTESAAHEVRIRCNDVSLAERAPAVDAGWDDVVALLDETLRSHADWFVRMRDVRRTRELISPVVPDLVHLSSAVYSDGLLSAVLRELVRSGDSIRNLPRILWLMIEAGSWAADVDTVRLSELPLFTVSADEPTGRRDPELIASSLRKRMADEAWRSGVRREPPPAVCLPAELEQRLVHPAGDDDRAAAEWAVVRSVHAIESPTLVAHSPHGVRPIRYALAACPRPPRVIASQELPADVDLPPVVQPPSAVPPSPG